MGYPSTGAMVYGEGCSQADGVHLLFLLQDPALFSGEEEVLLQQY